MRLQLPHERQRVRAFQLGITGIGGLEAQPDPLDAEIDELTDVVLSIAFADENTYKAQALPPGLHAIEQLHCTALGTAESSLSIMKNGLDPEFGVLASHITREIFLPVSLIEVDELSLSAEERGRSRRSCSLGLHTD